MKDGLTLIATKEFEKYDEMYKVVDFLNKNLREFNLIFGVKQKDNSVIMNIYKCD